MRNHGGGVARAFRPDPQQPAKSAAVLCSHLKFKLFGGVVFGFIVSFLMISFPDSDDFPGVNLVKIPVA